MYVFASCVFAGLSSFGLTQAFGEMGLHPLLTCFLSVVLVVILSVMQNKGRYE